MNPDGLVKITVGAVQGATHAGWAAGLDVSVPASIASKLSDAAGTLVAVDWKVAVDSVRLAAAYTERRPASSRLPFSYQIVPLPLRTAVGHALGRLQRHRVASWASYPGWPIDLSADFVADICGAPQSPYADGPAPVLVSHDIDTAEGLRNLVARFLPIEEAVGARSSNYVVPCAWPIDHSLLEDVVRRGHEVGVHGFDHSNFTPFAGGTERRARLEAARPLIERYGIIGYRAPSLLRTPELLESLAGLYRYDSSIPTSGGLFPVPNNGCATARPFRIGDLLEIPLSMPRDGSLMFLGHTPDEIFSIWQKCAEQIAASGGVLSLLTHCESRFSGGDAMIEAYRRFLAYVAADDRFVFRTPADILAMSDDRAA